MATLAELTRIIFGALVNSQPQLDSSFSSMRKDLRLCLHGHFRGLAHICGSHLMFRVRTLGEWAKRNLTDSCTTMNRKNSVAQPKAVKREKTWTVAFVTPAKKSGL